MNEDYKEIMIDAISYEIANGNKDKANILKMLQPSLSTMDNSPEVIEELKGMIDEIIDISNGTKKESKEAIKEEVNDRKKTEGIIEKFFKTTAGQHLQIGMQNALDTIKGNIDDILGEVKTLVIDPVMNLGKTAYNMLFDGDEEETGDEVTHSWLDTINDTLNRMFGLEKKKNLTSLRSGGKRGGIFGDLFDNLGFFGTALTIAGLALGTMLGAIWKPFQVIGNILKPLVSLLKPLAKLKGIKTLVSFFGKITSIFGSAGGLLRSIKFLRPLFKGLSFGLTKLAWPLQILLSAIDFIKGFVGSNEKTFTGKLVDGLKGMFIGFFELPIKLFGWVADKILGLFGAEIEGGAGKKMMEGVDMYFEWLKKLYGWIGDGFIWAYDNVIKPLFSFVKGYFMNIWDIFAGVYDLMTGDFTGFFDRLSNIGNRIKDFFDYFGGEGFVDGLIKSFTDFFDMLVSLPGKLWQMAKESIPGLDTLSDIGGTVNKGFNKFSEGLGKGVNSSVDFVKGFFGGGDDETSTPPNGISKTMDKYSNSSTKTNKEMINTQKELIDTTRAGNKELIDTTRAGNKEMISIIRESSSATVIAGGDQTENIPDSIESVQLLYMNTSWGMA